MVSTAFLLPVCAALVASHRLGQRNLGRDDAQYAILKEKALPQPPQDPEALFRTMKMGRIDPQEVIGNSKHEIIVSFKLIRPIDRIKITALNFHEATPGGGGNLAKVNDGTYVLQSADIVTPGRQFTPGEKIKSKKEMHGLVELDFQEKITPGEISVKLSVEVGAKKLYPKGILFSFHPSVVGEPIDDTDAAGRGLASMGWVKAKLNVV